MLDISKLVCYTESIRNLVKDFSQNLQITFYCIEVERGIMPGDNVTFEVKLQAPIAMEKGLTFAIREGGRTVGAGRVTEIVK